MAEEPDRLLPSPRVPWYMGTLDEVKVAIVAQSPGKTEVEQGTPLVGASGRLLQECAAMAGLDWAAMARTNVVEYNPPGNDFDYFCAKKKADVGGPKYPYGHIASGRWFKPEWFDQLERLKKELLHVKPNVVVAVGNEALWAMTGESGITKWRGSVMDSTLVPGLKVIPTFHPAAALRDYSMKPVIAMDLMKVKREAEFADIRIPSRKVWIYPTVEDLWHWESVFKRDTPLSVDIETKPPNQVTCIGFAFTPNEALVVPFWSNLREGNSYWRTLDEEVEAWEFVQHMLYTYPVGGQNFFAYDIMYLWSVLGIRPRRVVFDTMTLHHAFQPELEKSLGFMTSIYCNEPAYKNLRPRGAKMEKRDE